MEINTIYKYFNDLFLEDRYKNNYHYIPVLNYIYLISIFLDSKQSVNYIVFFNAVVVTFLIIHNH